MGHICSGLGILMLNLIDCLKMVQKTTQTLQFHHIINQTDKISNSVIACGVNYLFVMVRREEEGWLFLKDQFA